MIAELNKGNTVRKITEANNVFNTPVPLVATPVVSDGQIVGYVFVQTNL